MVPGEETSEEAGAGLEGRIDGHIPFKRLRLAFWLIGIALVLAYPVGWAYNWALNVFFQQLPFHHAAIITVPTYITLAVDLIVFVLLAAGLGLLSKSNRMLRIALLLSVLLYAISLSHGLLFLHSVRTASVERFWSRYGLWIWLGRFGVGQAILFFFFFGLFKLFVALGEREYAYSALARGSVFVASALLDAFPGLIRCISRFNRHSASVSVETRSVGAIFKAINIYAKVVAIVALIMLLHLLYRASRELAQPPQDDDAS